uniref:UBA domain-containing protein n=1 Tax=Octactis speculum TaxID=3111310 RepID=A0A7S2GH87_9STRA
MHALRYPPPSSMPPYEAQQNPRHPHNISQFGSASSTLPSSNRMYTPADSASSAESEYPGRFSSRGAAPFTDHQSGYTRAHPPSVFRSVLPPELDSHAPLAAATARGRSSVSGSGLESEIVDLTCETDYGPPHKDHAVKREREIDDFDEEEEGVHPFEVSALSALMDMGFQHRPALRTLRRTGLDVDLAMISLVNEMEEREQTLQIDEARRQSEMQAARERQERAQHQENTTKAGVTSLAALGRSGLVSASKILSELVQQVDERKQVDEDGGGGGGDRFSLLGWCWCCCWGWCCC